MKKIKTVRLLFEQSGTFKSVFRSLNYNAYDYDIENQFGETDFQLDIFKEINNAYERKESIFDTFDNIYVSFSGGKDSGMVLNLILDYKRKHGITKKIGVFHQDFESQYEETTKYVEKMFVEKLQGVFRIALCIAPAQACLPPQGMLFIL